VKRKPAAAPSHASPEQLAYAKVLAVATRLGALVLVLAFAGYVSGLLPAYVPLAQMPVLWHLPASNYLAATGMAPRPNSANSTPPRVTATKAAASPRGAAPSPSGA
jgi:hypothetical protein